ncbi:hypothetical protein PM3016_5466 [Paenibacillus mucilaginosus 3016]|uniref:Uncharacterized protein n=1 Tax=Paenibacillus mucilaginosus 3016 TaxID=1116391 RepID=H6NDW7_9BACL|nr:hypothetical protein PM3016_5466 [Paenibacillus mucilaginosus 3016]WFA20663.1 hypothetical protein ERY13_27190 [Paenibacillus mucilaginosus]
MNRWHVYEWLKQTYMATGIIPSMGQAQQHFSGRLDPGELVEGIDEFLIAIMEYPTEEAAPCER